MAFTDIKPKLSDDPTFARPLSDFAAANAPVDALSSRISAVSSSLATALPTASDGVSVLLTDSLSAPTYQWNLRYLAAATKWYPQGGASWGYGTSLPSVPALVDKVEFTLVDSVTLPTYQWTFRWNVGSSNTDKWEFVGGAPLVSETSTDSTVASVTYVDPSSTVVSVTIPRAGVYGVSYGLTVTGLQTANNYAVWGALKVGSAAAADADAALAQTGASGTDTNVSVARYQKKTCAASDVLKIQVRGATTTSKTIADQFIEVFPIRVS